jgi:lactoylglutathione lyase
MQIDHIAIWTNDLEKVKNFYLRYFGCKSNEKYENTSKAFSSYFLSFSNGMRIELMKRLDISEKKNNDSIGLAHFAINVGTKDKVDSLTKILQHDGFIIESYPRITGDGYYESVIRDPEHNKIELTAIEDYIIFEAKTGDLEKILYLQKCCYLSEASIYNDFSIQPLTQTLKDITLDFEKQIILKLEFRNKIVGSVRAYVQNETCYIGKLIVGIDYQNMGFGKLLLNAIEKKFDQVKRFELFTGFKSEKNLYLYHKLGYKVFKETQMNGITIKYLEKIVSS